MYANIRKFVIINGYKRMLNLSALWIIIGVCTLISYEGIRRPEWRDDFLFIPHRIANNQSLLGIFTHSWFHADWQHLLFNMFSLFSLGGILEHMWITDFGKQLGTIHFVVLYVVGGIAATALPFFRHKNNPSYRSLGASGAVSSVIFACILWNPKMELMNLFLPIPIPAYLFGIIYLGIEYYAMKKGNNNIANDGHISGAIFGIIYVLFLNIDKGKLFLHLLFK